MTVEIEARSKSNATSCRGRRLPVRARAPRFHGIFGVLGGGLLVASVPDAGAQQESGGGGQGSVSNDVAAWIHVDEAGRITGYTGKTEIGQNIRTSLAQAIADELRVPLTAVALVMADTDLVPFDQGTFGSLSTPRMAPVLARAAATAREMLIDRAAALWSVDRATLTCKDARISAARPLDRLRRSRQGPEAHGRRARRRPRDAAGVVDSPRHGREEGRRPELRHRRAPLHARPHAAGHAVRPRHPPDGYTGTLVSFDDAARERCRA